MSTVLDRALGHLEPLVVPAPAPKPPARRPRARATAAPPAPFGVPVPVHVPLDVPDLLQTPTLFLAWLERAGDGGKSRRFSWLPSPTGCPLACFLRETSGQPFVLVGGSLVYWGPATIWPAQHMPLPAWARAFILLWDALIFAPLPPSAAWARRVLRTQLWAAHRAGKRTG